MKKAPYETCVDDFQWQMIRRYLPKRARTGRPPVDQRRVFDALIYVLKSGCQWRMLPSEFPHWRTVYGHFQAWHRKGRLRRIHRILHRALRKLAGRNPKPSAAIIDSQTVRSAAHGGVVGYDAGKKTKGRKRFICVDTLGYLVALFIAPADTPERAGAKSLLSGLLGRAELTKIWADGGFSGQQLAGWVQTKGHGTELEIVRHSDTATGFNVLPKRWIVERTFAWLVQNRRLVRDYEKSIESADAFVYLASLRLMLNHYS